MAGTMFPRMQPSPCLPRVSPSEGQRPPCRGQTDRLEATAGPAPCRQQASARPLSQPASGTHVGWAAEAAFPLLTADRPRLVLGVVPKHPRPRGGAGIPGKDAGCFTFQVEFLPAASSICVYTERSPAPQGRTASPPPQPPPSPSTQAPVTRGAEPSCADGQKPVAAGDGQPTNRSTHTVPEGPRWGTTVSWGHPLKRRLGIEMERVFSWF